MRTVSAYQMSHSVHAFDISSYATQLMALSMLMKRRDDDDNADDDEALRQMTYLSDVGTTTSNNVPVIFWLCTHFRGTIA